MSRPAWINVGGQDSVGSATVTAATDELTVVGHSLTDGDIVMVDSLTGGAVGPLIEGAVYFVRNVSGDDFQLSGTRGSQIKEFSSDGTAEVYLAVPQYNAQVLRLNDTVSLFHGSSDPLGARQGVRPGSGDVVSVAGTDWVVHDHSGVVYPGITSVSGPYRYHQLETSDALDPADGSNDRVDGLDLVIEDDDEDASGFRRSRVEYVPGTPGAGAPAVTANSSRLGTILVPSGGSPSPSVNSLGLFTVASGGILPVAVTGDLPLAGRYEGMYADQADIDTLLRWTGSVWQAIASASSHTLIESIASLQWDFVAGANTHSSSSFGTLAGGPDVTLTVPASGRVLVMWGGLFDFGDAVETRFGRMRISMSGANAGTVGDSSKLAFRANVDATTDLATRYAFHVEQSLTPGSTTFTSEYAVSAGTIDASLRSLLVIPL